MNKTIITQYKIRLNHPTDKDRALDLLFYDEQSYRDWEPYLIKMEALLLSEKYKNLR